MHRIADLLTAWQTQDPTSPRLTWYGTGGERVELSGRVLANWAIKAANLLIEEADADPAAVVRIDLPVHWRALVWALGAWTAGAQVSFGAAFTGEDTAPGGADPQVLITDQPGPEEAAEVVVAVALPALALAFDGELPDGAIDGAADLMTYPDVLMQPPAETDLSALTGPATAVEQGSRLLLPVTGSDGDSSPGAPVLGQVLATWLASGSVVLVADSGADPGHLARVEGARVR